MTTQLANDSFRPKISEIAAVFDPEIVFKYRKDPAELLADAISEYLLHPQQTRETAPRFVQWLCALVDDEQEIRRFTAFVESGGLKPADDPGPDLTLAVPNPSSS